jgi:osmotically inducible protein OsmC
MQFSALLGEAGGTNITLDVTAKVLLGPDPKGGFRIPEVELSVGGQADGIERTKFEEIAENAKASCPVSKALAGTDIVLTFH